MAFSIKVLTNEVQVSVVQEEFDSFVCKWSENPFLLSPFIISGMKLCRTKGRLPTLIIVYDSNRIVGMAALSMRHRLGIRFSEFLLGSHFLPEIVVDDEYREACICAIIGYLTENMNCKFLDLTLSAESKNLPALEESCRQMHIFSSSKVENCHRIALVNCTWDEFVRKRGSNFRHKFRRIEQKFTETGNWKTSKIETLGKENELFDKILQIDGLSWKKTWAFSKGITEDPELLMLFRSIVNNTKIEPVFTWCAYFLSINDKIISYVLVFKGKETAFIKRTSYDESYRDFSPGLLIMNYAVRDLFENGRIRLIDWCSENSFMDRWSKITLPRKTIMVRKGIVPIASSLCQGNGSIRKLYHLVASVLEFE